MAGNGWFGYARRRRGARGRIYVWRCLVSSSWWALSCVESYSQSAFRRDHLAVWHRTAADTAAAARVRDALRRILQLPSSVPIEYKAHGDCLRATNQEGHHNDTGAARHNDTGAGRHNDAAAGRHNDSGAGRHNDASRS
ncbi:hypothetical protein ACJJTC_012599 [Scirpophaga incertulas]